MKLTVGTKIYYRGDMENQEAFGEIVEMPGADKYGQQLKIKLEDGRSMWIPNMMVKFEDTGNGLTRFCTEWAYRKKRKEETDKLKEWTKQMEKRRKAREQG